MFISINKNAITEYLFKDFIINEYLKKYDTSVSGKYNNKKRMENILYLANSLWSNSQKKGYKDKQHKTYRIFEDGKN